MAEGKFKISLRDNGEHSFKRSLESYREYEKSKDQMLLKDTIMFLHQSIELLMKEMLVNHSPYLIFEDLKDIPKKQKEADKQGIGIFFIEKPPRSVTYEVAIDRVEAFINLEELDSSLRDNLNRLNRLRNQLEHYAIEADIQEVVQLLEAIHKPILDLFEKHLGPLTQIQTPQINQTWISIETAAQRYYRKNHELAQLMAKFNRQKVAGKILGLEGEVRLPKFGILFENPTFNFLLEKGKIELTENTSSFMRRDEIDIFAEDETFPNGDKKRKVRWVVESKMNILSSRDIQLIHARLSSLSSALDAVPWLVVFAELRPPMRKVAEELGLMLTGPEELEELQKLVDPSDSA